MEQAITDYGSFLKEAREAVTELEEKERQDEQKKLLEEASPQNMESE